MDDPLCPPPTRREIPRAAAAEEAAGRSNPQLQCRGRRWWKRRRLRIPHINRETDDRLDRISELPAEIIHHIVSFLRTGEAVRVSAVSKTFRSVMGSFPIIDFDFDLFIKNSKVPLELLTEAMPKFLNYVDDAIKRRRSHELDYCIQKFRLVARIRSILHYRWNWTESDQLINRAISFAIERGLKELEIDLAFHPHYLLPKLITSSAKSNSITTLKLKGLKLDLDDLILSCPMIESLSLAECLFKDVKILSPNLRTFNLQTCNQGHRIYSIEIGAVNLQSFTGRGKYEIIDIEIGACKNLKNLSLYRFRVTREWLHKQISQLHRLENLALEDCNCLGTVEISHQNLKCLCLLDCNVEDVKVDAPNLVSFMYKGEVVPFHLLNPRAAVLDATLRYRPWNPRTCQTVECFFRFWELLSFYGHCKALTLCSSEKLLIFPECLRDILNSPLCDLKHLKIITSSMPCYTKLVDGLLWLAPHLETLCFSLKETKHQDSKAKFIKFCFANTYGGGGDLNCFCNEHLKCCRCHLKSVEMVNFEDIDDKHNLLKYFKQKVKSHHTVLKKYLE